MSDWHDETPQTPLQVTVLAAEARAAFPELEIDHDIAWLDAIRDQSKERLSVLTLREQTRLVGFAPLFVHPTHLQFHLGEVEIGRRRIQRFHLECGPILVAGKEPTDAVGCLLAIADKLPRDAVVFLRAVPETSALHGFLHAKKGALRSKYYVVPHGPRYLRCRIKWEGSFEQYLGTLGKVSRKDLRRTLKRPEKLFGVDFELRRYTGEAAVGEFLRLAREISDMTYQARLLGLGLSGDTQLPIRLEVAARRSQFLGHILFMKDQPVAFHYGLIHERRFYMADGGYDPAWAHAQVGMLIFLKVAQDIERHHDPITTFDYLYGDGAYKVRTSNDHTPERHYYLIRKTLAGAVLAATMVTTDGFSRSVGALLARYGLKDIVKSVIRRRSEAKSDE